MAGWNFTIDVSIFTVDYYYAIDFGCNTVDDGLLQNDPNYLAR